MNILQTWTIFKSTCQAKSLLMQYKEDNDKYSLWADENITKYLCTIYKDSPANTDQSDFETTYKTTANQPSQALKTCDTDSYAQGITRGSVISARIVDPASPPTLTSGKVTTLSVDLNGNLRVNNTVQYDSGVTGSAVPPKADYVAGIDGSGNLRGLSTDTSGKLLIGNFPVDSDTYAQGSTTSGQTGSLIQGAVTTSNPSYTTGQTSPLSLTTGGNLRTDNTTWLGSTAPTIGAKTSANSIPVVLASDQAAISVSSSVPTFTTYDGVSWLDTNVASNASVTHNLTVPNGVSWNLEAVSIGSTPSISLNKEQTVVDVIWDPTTANKRLAIGYSGGPSITIPITHRVTGDGTKVLRVVVTNGGQATSSLATALHYFIG